MEKSFVDLKNYSLISLIQKYSNSHIFQVEERNTNHTFAAIVYNFEFDGKDEAHKYLFRDLNFLLKLSNPAIIKIKGISQTDFNQENHPVFISEYVSDYTLDQVIQNEKTFSSYKNWNLTKKLINIYGIASALSYLHKEKIIHQNLNPENIFETSQFYPKLLYLGLSKKHNQSIKTKIFLAPEILSGEEITSSSNVYSFGMIVYSIMAGEKPFEHELHQKNLFEKIINGYRPNNNTKIPPKYRQLIESCWSHDPTTRPNFETIIDELKTINGFITTEIDRNEFESYIQSIEKVNHIKNIQLKKFEKLELIGAGSFSDVYKIKNKKTNEIFAGKILKILKNQENFLKEVNILSQLRHPCIMKFIGFSPINFDSKLNPVIVTEYLSNGSLEDICEIERSGISIPFWSDTLKLINIFGIASSMSFLHSKNILHRDLKPGNILINEYLFPKLADFGFSTFLSDLKDEKIQVGTIGTASFIAPEILKENKYSKSSDVYAFGMLVYEIMEKEFPFDGVQNILIEYKVSVEEKRPEFKIKIPEIYENLIKSCWNQDPNKRPSFDEIVFDLKNNKDFITDKIDEKIYRSFVDLIDEHTKNSNNVDFQNEYFHKYSLKSIFEQYENMMEIEMSSF